MIKKMFVNMKIFKLIKKNCILKKEIIQMTSFFQID